MPTSARTSLGFFGQFADVGIRAPEQKGLVQQALVETQLLRWPLQLGTPVEDTLVEYCGYTHRTVVQPLRHNPACPCNHTRFALRFTTPLVSVLKCLSACGRRL